MGGYVARLLRRDDDEEVELMGIVHFGSLHAIRAFAGPTVRSPLWSRRSGGVLSRFDPRCRHYTPDATA